MKKRGVYEMWYEKLNTNNDLDRDVACAMSNLRDLIIGLEKITNEPKIFNHDLSIFLDLMNIRFKRSEDEIEKYINKNGGF